ncbi:MAG: ceramidase domain-containing protein [Ilumatobacteraceae bacterium]
MISPPTLGALVEMGSSLVAEIGDTDCEELGAGSLVQPVNAITSFAYVVVGVVVAVVAIRRDRQRTESLVFAVLLAAIGLGSVAFHGPQPTGARLMHDLPILLTALFMLVHDLRLLRPGLTRWAFPAAAVVATVLAAVSADAGVAATGVVLVAVGLVEVVVYRRRLRPIQPGRQRRWAIAIAVIVAVGGASWLLGRTDSPVCDPDGVFQFHGLWHLVSAIAFGAWWFLAIGAPNPNPPGSDLEDSGS